jgi:phage major head subunit gpT-like protein
MMNFTGENGLPLGVKPDLLVVPPALERTALEIVNADMIPSDAGTAPQTNVLKGSARVLVVPELTSATRWYLFDTRKPIKPLIWQLRRTPTLVSKTQPTDEGVFWDNMLHWGVDGRAAAGYGLWFLACRSAP